MHSTDLVAAEAPELHRMTDAEVRKFIRRCAAALHADIDQILQDFGCRLPETGKPLMLEQKLVDGSSV